MRLRQIPLRFSLSTPHPKKALVEFTNEHNARLR
jgi:hypothetical protein